MSVCSLRTLIKLILCMFEIDFLGGLDFEWFLRDIRGGLNVWLGSGQCLIKLTIKRYYIS